MADTDTPGSDSKEEAPKPKKKLPGKVLVLYIGLPAVVVVLAGALTLTLLGGGGGTDAEEAVVETVPDVPDLSEVTFIDLPQILVNINTGPNAASYLKLQVALEVTKDTDLTKIEPAMPRIVDRFQVYLRELRLEDLSGSEGTFRLKEELLRRVNAAVAPIEVRDVLFKEMIIQ